MFAEMRGLEEPGTDETARPRLLLPRQVDGEAEILSVTGSGFLLDAITSQANLLESVAAAERR